jgi:integrase
MPTNVAVISREHVEAFITDQLARWRPATAANRYRGLQRFFASLVDQGEIKASPIARMKPPHVPDEPPPVLRDEELGACWRRASGARGSKIAASGVDPGVHRHRRPTCRGRHRPTPFATALRWAVP